MTVDTTFLLQIIAIFVGGGSVQLVIFLFRRRAEIRELDSKADAVSLEASNNLITRLQLEAEQLRKQLADMRADNLRETEEMIRRLSLAHEEGVRMQRELALLRTEIGIAQRQLEQLGGPGPPSYPGAHRGR